MNRTEKIEIKPGRFVPRYINKFFEISLNLIKSLNEGCLWFSDPLSFNDPYDCNIQVTMEGTKEEFNLFFTNIKTQQP
jgi:hypothetical protein